MHVVIAFQLLNSITQVLSLSDVDMTGFFVKIEGEWSGDIIETFPNQWTTRSCLMKCVWFKTCETISYNDGTKMCELYSANSDISKIRRLNGWNIYRRFKKPRRDVIQDSPAKEVHENTPITMNDTTVICEHRGTKTIKCPYDYQRISVSKAFYGRRESHICTEELDFPSCDSFPTTEVQSQCNGKHSCTLQASNDIYEQPCSGTRKYLEVEYSCSGMRPNCNGQISFGGNGLGNCCVFPFLYDGVIFNECINWSWENRKWCATTDNYDEDELWGYCTSID